jgi:imidazolonepropionase-like amidohydrolase
VNGVASGDAKLPVLVARNGDEARLAFDRLYKLNVDFISVLSSLPRDAYFALAELARHWDLPLVGHIPGTVTAQEAVAARQKSLEHLLGVSKSVSNDAEALRFFAQCALTGTRISPTLVFWQRMSHVDDPRWMNNPSLKAIPASIRNLWPDISADPDSWKRQIWRTYRLTALASQAKAEILAGTGAGDPFVMPGEALHDELEQLVEAGLTARQALEAATLAPARFLEVDQKVGTIEKGKLADLVLLDDNPVLDIRNVRKVQGVFVKGRYLSRQEIDALLQVEK